MGQERPAADERRGRSHDFAATMRDWIAQAFTRVEDLVYVGLGVLLAASAVVLLGDTALTFGRALVGGQFAAVVIDLLDRILLILMIVEVLYTVQVSFREHTLVPEPFLIIGLIAVTRRILVVVAELGELLERTPQAFTHAMWELGLLTLLTVALVGSLLMLRRRGAAAVANRA
jgi:uncharacterized membrane protein (DUF373 family)